MIPRAVCQRAVAQAGQRRQHALQGASGLWNSTGSPEEERITTGHTAPSLSRFTDQAGSNRLLPPTLHDSSQLDPSLDRASFSRTQCSSLPLSTGCLRPVLEEWCLPKPTPLKSDSLKTQFLSKHFQSAASPSLRRERIPMPDRTIHQETTGLAGGLTGGSASWASERSRLPAQVPWAMGVPRRSLNIFSVFSKEEREKAKERLRDELNRGYFDDFKELKDTNGKVGGPAPASLLPAAGAAQFPPLQTFTALGQGPLLPPEGAPALIFVSFRAGAQAMVDSWILKLLAPGAAPHTLPSMIQVSFVESGVLSLPLLRPLVLRMLTPPKMPSVAASSEPASSGGLHGLSSSTDAPETRGAGETSEPTRILADAQEMAGREQGSHSGETGHGGQGTAREVRGQAMEVAYAFGDTWTFRKSLRIRNKLTGYVFLVDRKGRVRWRGTGFSTDSEVESLCNALEKLQHE